MKRNHWIVFAVFAGALALLIAFSGLPGWAWGFYGVIVALLLSAAHRSEAE
ncbi:hypothetical protein [Candidatus Solirubrobacter pratensis]|uniref:hypothetical protein n=1 Tax=Candidatus Solirubrobacter pratensis TaxID=1298857 RepID=UPI0003FA91B8|nr:hypothetical protein [Candidatus Solirubrobacter pratensis]